MATESGNSRMTDERLEQIRVALKDGWEGDLVNRVYWGTCSECGNPMDDVIAELVAEVDRLRAIESAAARRDLEDAIEFAAGELPDDWIIRLDTENCSCCIDVGRPHDDYWVQVVRYD